MTTPTSLPRDVGDGERATETGWRPIETAPRDGTSILVGLLVHYRPPHRDPWTEWQSHVVWFDEERGGVDLDCDPGWDWDDFTHWQSLPAPPSPPARLPPDGDAS